MRKTVAFSYIHRAVSRTRQWCTTTGAVLDALRDFYCGPNGVFRLGYKYSARSERSDAFLEQAAREGASYAGGTVGGVLPAGLATTAGADGDGERANIDTAAEAVDERGTRRRCRDALLRAIRADGKVLQTHQRNALSLEHVFSAETVQRSIDALTTETTPGRDGWPAHFFKVVGKRVHMQKNDGGGGDDSDDEADGAVPSPLANLLAHVFLRCAKDGQMMDMMRDSTVSLIYKDKGSRTDLGKYRPIAVNSTLYRIMAKSLVVAMGPVLATVTSEAQRAFKPGEVLQSNTQQVQDVIAYCAHMQAPGFIVFADQDGAYPRVSWQYMFEVMHAMGFPTEFCGLVRTMYSGISLHFKVNGTIDSEAAVPANGIAQGCPVSPCLYLLCIQGFLSLVRQDARLTTGLRGIAVPREKDAGQDTLIASAFADDLCLFLRDADQLPRFRQLLEVYEEGAGALNSWAKTEALRIGSLVGSEYLPEGWQEGRDISTQAGVIRYLGVFLGTTDRVAAEWEKRTTTRIRRKADVWRERRMPVTRAGRGTALRNSILAQAWFLVNNQVPPNLADMMNEWRKEAWAFYGNHGREARGSTNVRHDTLVQDYTEGGQRAPDVESFGRAIQVSKITRLLQPSEGLHLNFLQYWMSLDYGVLRQGARLLLSQCDFLRVRECVPLMWRVFLKNVGSMPGLGAATTTGVRASRAHMGGTHTMAGEIPQHDGRLTLGEVLMEPLLFNPRLCGPLNP